ncbi:MAG: AbrB/MazE/SpoVT family DNA-binding domain-containing protein [Ruminococcus sp.]|nr:AbrB/MazE/SpoVT family DNA-binding domain-containing protein [Ruminococcus sp.]
METRNAKLIVNKSGGTATGKSNTYRVTLPTSWITKMGLGELNRELELYFDGNKIIVTQKTNIEEFLNTRKHHKLIKLDYYNFDDLITTIIADYTDEVIKINLNYSHQCLIIASTPKKHR